MDFELETEEASDSHSPRWIQGEKALLCQVLERAALDLISTTEARREDREDAHRWVFEEYGTEAFSFNWICEWLGLCPDVMREKLLDMLQNGFKGTVGLAFRGRGRNDRCRVM